MATSLLIATTSQGKLREWRNLLLDLPLDLLDLGTAQVHQEVEETGRTFRANALIKAAAYGQASGLLTLAEDSGLSVRGLGGAPGVFSARWEGDDYIHKNAKLIDLLRGKEGPERACQYVCQVIVRHPDGRLWTVRGSVRGQIGHAPAGARGFGYDPVFFIPRLGRTLAEIPVADKDRISHRGHAARRVRTILRSLLDTS